MPKHHDDDDRLPIGRLCDGNNEFDSQRRSRPRRNRQLTIIAVSLLAVVATVIFVAVIYSWVGRVREDADESKAAGNLSQIGFALQNFHDHRGELPLAAIRDKNGKPLLSWRVAILEYIEQSPLYREFRLDEPWDSPHNNALLSRMPRIYAPPGDDQTAREFKTYYRVFTGKGTLFPDEGKFNFDQATDGLSNVVMVVEAGESVPLTKPDELDYDPNQPLPRLGGRMPNRENFLVVMANGKYRKIKRNVSEQSIRAAIVCNDGINPGSDW